MYLAIIFMENGKVVEHKFNSYPGEKDLESIGLPWECIVSYEVHY